MAKRLKLRISKAISRSFHSCRSKDPCTLPQHPDPSFFPNTQILTVDHFLIITPPAPPSQLHQGHTTGGQCSSTSGEAYNTSDDSHSTRSHSQEFSQEFKWKKEEDKWQHVVKTTYNDDTEQQRRRKISYSSVSDDSDNDEVLAMKNKHQSSRTKKNNTSKTIFLMMMRTTSSSSAEKSGCEKANWDHEEANWNHDYINNINKYEEDETETETLVSTLVSSSCKSYVEFLDDSYETTTTRSPKKIATTKRRVKNIRDIMNKNGRRSSISTSTTSSDGELPPRLSELIPCNVEGKVKESFAIMKKSEDPYEDFKSSMMEMILEKKMFEKNDLEQLLQCFLSLNAKNNHGVIVEAFSEIWKTLFSPNHN